MARENEPRLYGREQIFHCVEQGLERSGVPARPLPIVLLAGPRGSGGTALLDALWERFSQDALGVHLDLREAQEIRDIVLTTMQGLQRRVLGIRPVHFARLRLALKALTFVDDGNGRNAFDAFMKARASDAAIAALQGWLAGAAQLLQSGPPVPVELFTRVARLVLSQVDRARDSDALAWFARNGIYPGAGRGYDPLWELYRWQHDGGPGGPRMVDMTLCAALLADLRADYNTTGILHARRARNCLLLADNAGSRVGNVFLELVEECRRTVHAAGEPGDPLLLVAARRGRPQQRLGPPLASTDVDLSLVPEEGESERWWYPIRLTDLSPDHVAEMNQRANMISALGSARRDADFVHALTGGHPAATRHLVGLLARHGERRGFDARDLLEPPSTGSGPQSPKPDAEAGSAEDLLIARAFTEQVRLRSDGSVDPRNNPLLDAMAVCAATPGLRYGACEAVFRFMGWTASALDVYESQLESPWWLVEGAGGEQPHVHPLARLLLARWLARDPGKWRDVHQGYVAHYARPEDAALRRHHSLALVEIARVPELTPVAGYLEAELDSSTAADWLSTLGTVTAAPNRLRTARDPATVVTTLAGTAEPGERRRVITRLAVAHWLFNDRLFDPARQLANEIAVEYANLARLPCPEREPFYLESAKYQRIAKEWSN